VTLVVAVILLAPTCLVVLARIGRRTPISVRLALRDLARYRARSGSALAAISVGVVIAVMICVLAAARYGSVLDWAGPNLASNQLIVYTPQGPGGPGPGAPAPTTDPLASWEKSARAIAASLGSSDVVALEQTSASLDHAGPGRQWSGQIYVATPALLAAFGIDPATIDPSADVLTSRAGLESLSAMQLQYGSVTGKTVTVGPNGPAIIGGPPQHQGHQSYPCPPGSCVPNPKIQYMSGLPTGTSAPNTVFTEHAIEQLGLQPPTTAGWLIQTSGPLTAAQVQNVQDAAAAAGLSVETKNDAPTSAEVINWATVFGIVLALAVLAMTVGLIRSETASDLRVLTATGASSGTRRRLTAVTASALAFLGALLGTLAAYVAVIAFSQSNNLDGLSSLQNVPLRNLLLIVVGMPLVAFVGGWLFAGRQPAGLSQQPLE
jgi:putative ABC transport system permease protein